MCPQHRKEKIQFMHNLLNQDKPVICIATQLIEAGVNISFRCVIRSISGLDNIAQAAGRCNRHGEAGKVCPVYIIKLKEETLGSLPEITIAQEITQQMIDSEKYSDLLAPNTISDFFRRLYAQEKKQLLYNVPQKETLVNLLSLNKNRWEISPQTSCKFCSQAFKTAGKNFEVIDNHAKDIIIPYDSEAQDMIYQLENSPANVNFVLRKAQKYMVNIHASAEQKLRENHAIKDLQNGIMVLQKAYYNAEFGVDIEGAEKETLIF